VRIDIKIYDVEQNRLNDFYQNYGFIPNTHIEILVVDEENQEFYSTDGIINDKELEEAIKRTEEKTIEHIDFILKTTNQISLNKITSILGSSDEFIINYLQKLEEEGKIIQLDDKKEVACNLCDSVRTSQIFYCPNCKSSDFKLGKLIEHYDCGNVSEERTYQNDECPNCKKKIKALGVDYKVLQNQYICNDCKEFFPEISIDYLCLKCQNRFKLEDARWRSSTNYKVK